MISQDWGDLIMLGILAFLLIIGLIATIRNKRKQDQEERNFRFDILSYQMREYIKNAIKAGVKEAIKEIKDDNQNKNT
jgi:hypothetical protein